jgi:uncharacterized protein
MSRNELSGATSPYLLQHKDNPVHWREWGAAALEEAQASGKPILLSVGYAACHWCHVMAHESFEDDATAGLMNDLFVNIKVDREERPDIDHLYMSALHALGEQGGWPLTMFLTGDGKPFWGGTYFPPAPSHGRPAFKTLLAAVARTYADDKDQINTNTQALGDALEKLKPAPASGALSFDLLDDLAGRAAGHMDKRHGGLRGAPKFPNCGLLELLWRAADRMGDASLRAPVLTTLRQICQGGIYDHLGGGFARYSVDERWLVPHFEKMLYDNAQLLDMLALGFAQTAEALFATRARETVSWLTREMLSPQGGFFASLDADSEGAEGKFYIWSEAELIEAIGAEATALFARFYDVSRGGNFSDPHNGETANVLNRLNGLQGDVETEAKLAAWRAELFARRAGRVRPGLDDKVLADWNGLMIAALARASAVFDEPTWLGLAARAFDFIAKHMSEGARLNHAWRNGARGAQGFALDYAAMIRAALALHEVTQETGYLEHARKWADTLIAFHTDAETGMLYTAAADATGVPLRLAPTSDEAVPNAHGPWLHALAHLGVLTGEPEWHSRADALFGQLAADALGQGLSHCSILNAFDFRRRNAHVAIVEGDGALLAEALRHELLNRIVERVALGGGAATPAVSALARLSAPAAVVCRSETCSAPVHDAAGLRRLMSTSAA